MPESLEVLEAVEAGYFRITDMPPILGLTKQRCSQLTRRSDFPSPAKSFGTRRLWRRGDVERWRDEVWVRHGVLPRTNRARHHSGRPRGVGTVPHQCRAPVIHSLHGRIRSEPVAGGGDQFGRDLGTDQAH